MTVNVLSLFDSMYCGVLAMNNIKIGDRVIMNNKYLVSEKDKGKTWTVRSNPWNCCGTIVVLLEGKSGGYAIDGLNVVEERTKIDNG